MPTKSNLKEQPPSYYELDKRVEVLARENQHLRENYVRIEKKLDELGSKIDKLDTGLSERNGATSFRNKIIYIAYMIISICAALGLHELVFKR